MKRIPAYIDSFGGLIPCMVVAAREERGELRLAAKVTSERNGPYKLGEIVERSALSIVPRSAVYRSRQACGQYRIRPYNWRDLI